MPFILFVMWFAGAIMLFRADIGEADRAREQEQARAVASQMAWYHNAAVRACLPAGTCPSGEVTVSEASINTSGILGQRLRALTDGRWVVTTWRNAPANGRGEPMQGVVATELRRLSQNSLGVGVFNATNCQVQASRDIARYEAVTVDGRSVLMADASQTGSATFALPSAIGGVALRHGAAVIATRVGDAAAGPCTGGAP